MGYSVHLFTAIGRVRDELKRSLRGPGLILFLTALAFYLPGIWWGIPYASASGHIFPWGADEIGPLDPITEVYGVFFARHPVFNPKYPLLQHVVQSLFVAPYYLFLYVTGGLRHPSPIYPFGFVDPISALRTATVLARLPSLIMAAGVVLIGYRTAATLWGRTTGILAGLFLIPAFPMVYYARTSNVDMGALFWTALGLAVFGQAITKGLTTRRTLWLALFAGLATGTKDPNWTAFLGMGVGLMVSEFRRQRDSATGLMPVFRNVAIGIVTGGIVWSMASGLVFRPSRYIAHLHFLFIFPAHGIWPLHHRSIILGHPPTLTGYADFAADIIRAFAESLGPVIFLCAIAGIVIGAYRDRKILYWLLPPVAVLALTVLPVRWVAVRLVLVDAYVLALLAAYLLGSVFRGKYKPVVLVIACVGIGWSLLRSADLTYQMIFDSRYEVARWLHRNASPGDRILHYTDISNLPPLDSGIRTIRDLPGSGFNNPNRPPDKPYEFHGDSQDPEFVILVPVAYFPPELWYEQPMPPGEYQKLRDGSLGYAEVLSIQSPRLFWHRPIPFVNPHVTVFERKDLVVARRSLRRNE